MKEDSVKKPEPKALVVCKPIGNDYISVYMATRQAYLWTREMASHYGTFTEYDGNQQTKEHGPYRGSLDLSLCFDIGEVVAWLESYGK